MALRILYNSLDPAYKTPFGVVTPGESCTMNLAIPAACQTTQAVLVLQQENGTQLQRAVEKGEGGSAAEMAGLLKTVLASSEGRALLQRLSQQFQQQ